MYKDKFPMPKKYWLFICMIIFCAFLLIGNYYRTDSWTGDKPFSEFVQRDWILLALFLTEEFIIALLIFFFAIRAGKISIARNQEILAYWEQNKYKGIKPGDYDYIWLDYNRTERALILKQGEVYKLYLDEYDEKVGTWCSVDSVSVYNDLDELKKALLFDFEFYCEENAELDEHGDEFFRYKRNSL